MIRVVQGDVGWTRVSSSAWRVIAVAGIAPHVAGDVLLEFLGYVRACVTTRLFDDVLPS
jgi:hypothetical protein